MYADPPASASPYAGAAAEPLNPARCDTPLRMAPSEAQVLEALKHVEDPDLHRDIVSLGFVKNLHLEDGTVSFDIDLTTPACPVRDQLEAQARGLIAALPGVHDVKIRVTSSARAGGLGNVGENLRGVRHIVAVASVNLAVALARAGARVGVLDADVYGPSVPGMVGLGPDATLLEQQGKVPTLTPVERYGLKVMSMGFLTTKETPVVWRGPMATKLVQQFLGSVAWGDLDYLLIDLPPGTGDIQLTLAQSVPLSGVVVVTTPQDAATHVAERGAHMFPKLNVPILGVLENMSHYECPECGHVAHLFRQGGGAKAAELLGAPLLGQVPLQESVAAGGDSGVPILLSDASGAAARAYADAAGKLARRVSVVEYQLRAAEKTKPTQYRVTDDGRLETTWSDGHVGYHGLRALRAACPCAHCVDEWTGKRLIVISNVSPHVSIENAEPVGRYATRFVWTDGHGTGLYTFARLRASCECEACTAARAAGAARVTATA
jgi:ATP-binding protein involved in chromosome partitioning